MVYGSLMGIVTDEITSFLGKNWGKFGALQTVLAQLLSLGMIPPDLQLLSSS
jgi:hypothetical protein